MVEKTSESYDDYYRGLYQADIEDLMDPEYLKFLFSESRERMDILEEVFSILHQLPNNPETREWAAPAKMKLVEGLAKASLERRPDRDWEVTERVLRHEKTGVMTNNLEIKIGKISSGPVFILYIHHDTIYVQTESGLVPVSLDPDTGTMTGNTIQDNTIHLATLLTVLDQLECPEDGGFLIVLTDHEENGCRGSGAYLAELLRKVYAGELNLANPIALVTAESTQPDNLTPEMWDAVKAGELWMMIGNAQKGKFYGEVVGDTSQVPLADAYMQFFRAMRHTQRETHNISEKQLRFTTGISSFGRIDKERLFAVNDFRTNNEFGPDRVGRELDGAVKAPPDIELDPVLFETILERIDRFISIGSGGIHITSESKYSHPSLFDSEKDESVLPVLYMLMQALIYLQMDGQIESIEWGHTSRRNSIPLEAHIEGDFSNVRVEDIHQALVTIRDEGLKVDLYQVPMELDLVSEQHTRAITPSSNYLNREILNTMHLESFAVNFMSDIGVAYAWFCDMIRELHPEEVAEKLISQILPYILGVGPMSRLHSLEKLTRQDREWYLETLPQFANLVLAKMYQKWRETT